MKEFLLPLLALLLDHAIELVGPRGLGVDRDRPASADRDACVHLGERVQVLIEGGVAFHMSCHSRAQNFGQKGAELLNLIPQADVAVVERCSGHGGSWGIMKDNFEVAMKVGKPVSRTAVKDEKAYVASECPLAADHILQGMERIDAEKTPSRSYHPVELMAMAYGIEI